jgi:acetoin utilization deacetylase AcuC-like enzyme
MQIIYSEKHQLHNTAQVTYEGQPFETEELPARAELILEAVRAAGLGPVVPPTDHGFDPILAVHDAEFVLFLQTVYAEQAASFGTEDPVFTWTFATRQPMRKPESLLGLKGYYCFGWGTPVLEGTFEAAYWSAQSALSGADLILEGERAVYALCRPPGHHAAADLYGGFCYLNNAAIAARYLGRDLSRVAVLDIDYHHGNGTQSIFYRDPAVLFCSLHAHPDEDYPFYWGGADETGEGPGEGTNHNWPLTRDTDDAGYLLALDGALSVIRTFAPDCLVLSAGFDTIDGDPVGCFKVTRQGFLEVGRRIAGLGLPTLIVQEGGYLLERLAADAIALLQTFASHR